MTEAEKLPGPFNSDTDDLRCQILKLSCTSKVEMKEVQGGRDPFLIYSLFDPKPREPTLIPYTDESNPEDYYILHSVKEGARNRMDDSYRYANVIGMTVYNEDFGELVESLRGVLLGGGKHDLDLSNTLVVIVVDGCDILNKEEAKKVKMTKTLRELGLYDKERVAATRKHWDRTSKPEDELCFVFESEVELADEEFPNPSWCSRLLWQMYPVKESGLRRHIPGESNHRHVRVVFAVKPYNRKKLHSHLWLMFGFCIFLSPDFVFLIDIGTEATRGSLGALEVYMRKHPRAGGCCGEIIVKDWFPENAGIIDSMCLIAQWFEYKIGHVMNKPLEDIMGYIGVLPGAFSCYRWAALKANNFLVLGQYFRPFIAPHTLPWKLSNIYHLAEDRIMSEEIIKLKERRIKLKVDKGEVKEVGKSKKPIGYTLGFVKTAKALTEGAPDFVTLIKQRRRWINGGWFAMIKMVLGGSTLSEIKSSGHHCIRKFWLLAELFYLFVVISFSWVSVGAYYLGAMLALTKILKDENTAAYTALRYLYIFHLAMVFIISLSLKPESAPRIWKYFAFFFMIVSYAMFSLVIYFGVFGKFDTEWAQWMLLSVVGVMALAVFFYGEEYFKILLATIAYLGMLPSYINILSVYAICQTDDISWGTRGGAESETQSHMSKSFSALKTWYLLFYIVCNIAFGMGFENISRTADNEANSWRDIAQKEITFLYGVCIGVLLFTFIAMVLYLFLRTFRCCTRMKEVNVDAKRIQHKLKKEYRIKKEDEMKRRTLKNKFATYMDDTRITAPCSERGEDKSAADNAPEDQA